MESGAWCYSETQSQMSENVSCDTWHIGPVGAECRVWCELETLCCVCVLRHVVSQCVRAASRGVTESVTTRLQDRLVYKLAILLLPRALTSDGNRYPGGRSAVAHDPRPRPVRRTRSSPYKAERQSAVGACAPPPPRFPCDQGRGRHVWRMAPRPPRVRRANAQHQTASKFKPCV